MAENTKTKVLQINTTGAEKNVKTLKQQIKELRDQMGQLEKGTAEYDAVAKQLGETLQKQKEITEATKNTSQDFGATLSNLSGVAAGVLGAFNAVNAAMVMMGADGEEAQQAMKSVQMTMAIIQGMGAMDNASKALKRIINSFSSVSSKENISNTQQLSNAEKDLERSIIKTTAAQQTETQTTNVNTTAKKTNATATKTATAANNAMNVSGTASVGVFARMRLGLQSLAASMKAFALSNPFTTLLLGASAVVGIISAITSATKDANEELDKQKTTVDDLVGGYLRLSQVQGNIASGIDFENDEKTINSVNALLGQYYKFSKESIRAGHDRNQTWKEFYSYIYKTGTEEQKQIVALAQSVDNLNQAHNNLTRTIRQEYDSEVDRQEAINTAREAELKMEEERNAVYNQYIQSQKKDLDNTKNIKKSWEDILKSLKELKKTILDLSLNFKTFKMIFDGFYDETEIQLEKIRTLIQKFDLEGVLTDKYKQELKEGFKELSYEVENGVVKLGSGMKEISILPETISLSYIVDDKELKRIEDEINEWEKKVDDYINKKGSVTEEEYNYARKYVEELKTRAEALNALAEETQKLSDIAVNENRALIKDNQEHLKALEYQERMTTYMIEMRDNNPYAEINKDLDEYEKSLKRAEDQLKEYKKEFTDIMFADLQNKRNVERYQELATLIKDSETEIFNLKMSLEDTYYQKRLKDIESLLKEEEANANGEAWKQEKYNLDWGQTDNYNLNVKAIQNQIKMIKDQMLAVESYYEMLQAEFEVNSEKWIELEIEKNATLEEIDRQHMEKSVQLEQEKSRRRLTIAKTYISLYSSISSQIGSILSAEMDRYDENTEEYKKLKYRQGVISTAEGVLGAFMSGVESGVPAPWNLLVAAAMAATTLTAGIMQLNNIKNEKVGGTMPTTTDLSSREYDTLTYAQGADTLSAIQDQRCYVLESDITDTQNRVQVSESQATF